MRGGERGDVTSGLDDVEPVAHGREVLAWWEERVERAADGVEERRIGELQRGGQGEIGRVEETLAVPIGVVIGALVWPAGANEHIECWRGAVADIDGEIERVSDASLNIDGRSVSFRIQFPLFPAYLDTEEQDELRRIDRDVARDRELGVLPRNQSRYLLAVDRLVAVLDSLLRWLPAVRVGRLGPLLDLESGRAALPAVGIYSPWRWGWPTANRLPGGHRGGVAAISWRRGGSSANRSSDRGPVGRWRPVTLGRHRRGTPAHWPRNRCRITVGRGRRASADGHMDGSVIGHRGGERRSAVSKGFCRVWQGTLESVFCMQEHVGLQEQLRICRVPLYSESDTGTRPETCSRRNRWISIRLLAYLSI